MAGSSDAYLPLSGHRPKPSQPRGSAWQPPPGRSASSPHLERWPDADCHTPGRRSARRRPCWEQGAQSGDGSEPEVAGGRGTGEERVKEECHRLRRQLSERGEEVKQLHRRVELLEGNLQSRTQQLEQVIVELQSAAIGLAPVPLATSAEQMDGLMQAHYEAFAQRDARAQERQHLLLGRLAEARSDSQRLLARLRADPAPRTAAVNLAAAASANAIAAREPLLVPPRLKSAGQVRRSVRHQEDLLAEYEQAHRSLHARVLQMAQQLDEEKESRRSREITTSQLADMLHSARAQASRPARDCSFSPAPVTASLPLPHFVGRVTEETDSMQPTASSATASWANQIETTPPPDRGLTPAAGTGAGGARALRLELDALRGEERAMRAEARRRHQAAAAAPSTAEALAGSAAAEPDADETEFVSPGGTALSTARSEVQESSELVALRLALQDAQAAAQFSERRATDAEAAATEALRGESQVSEDLQAAERRAWSLTEALNELALQSDLRLEKELIVQLELRRALRDMQLRCEVLDEVTRQLAQGFSTTGRAG